MIKEISILGLNYKVEEVEVVDKHDPSEGQIDFFDQIIKIDRSLSKERKEIVLLHEIIHGICDILKFHEINDNECQVQGFAVALHQVLKENTISF